MVAAATTSASQAAVFATVSEPTEEAYVSQASAFAAYSAFAPLTSVSQVSVYVAEDSQGNELRVTQAPVLAAVIGRTDDPSVRAWPFTIDGHDMYVLRLGIDETLVYDVATQQWYQWGSNDGILWNVYHGENWVAGNKFATDFGSNVLVGSDSNGALYFLSPDLDQDDTAVSDRAPAPFIRRVTSQIPLRGYNSTRMYDIQLIGSTGELSADTLTGITLSYSDDRGDNFVSAGTIDISDEDYLARAQWRSMGSMRAPGRIVRIEDNGALRRIDSLTMNTDMADGT